MNNQANDCSSQLPNEKYVKQIIKSENIFEFECLNKNP